MQEMLACPVCRATDFEVLRNERRGFIVLCNECGYASRASLEHLQAS